MPTYEYQCVSCGHRFEKFQSFSAEPIKECPVCGAPVKKVITPAGIIFKGSGWYITDSKKTNSSAPAAANSEKKSDNGDNSSEKAASDKTGEAAKPAETAPAAASPEKKSDSKPADSKSPNAAA